MSAYKLVKCNIEKEQYVLAGLKGIGFTADQIEIHDQPVSLYGYRNDQRKQEASIIVRRAAVNTISGGASNDIGFKQTPTGYEAYISDYDSRWWKRKEPEFLPAAAKEKAVTIAKRKGYRIVERKTTDGNIHLRLHKNF